MNTTLDRIKKGVRADAVAKKLVKSTYRLFFNAAGLSGATLESYLPLNACPQGEGRQEGGGEGGGSGGV